MNDGEDKKVKLINKYIDNIVSNMRSNGVVINKRGLNKFRSMYISSSKSVEEVYRDIDNHIETYLTDYSSKLVYYDKLRSLKVKNRSNRIM